MIAIDSADLKRTAQMAIFDYNTLYLQKQPWIAWMLSHTIYGEWCTKWYSVSNWLNCLRERGERLEMFLKLRSKVKVHQRNEVCFDRGQVICEWD